MNIRTLTDFDRDCVRDFYRALTAEDRYKRFCASLSDETVSAYVDGLDFTRHPVLGAFAEAEELIGIAELAPGADQGEMAFAVRQDMRSQGIGTALTQRLLERARMCGMRKVFVLFLADNTPMRKLALHAGMRLKDDGGAVRASCELAAPSAGEFNQWFIEEAIAHSGYFSVLGRERCHSLVHPRGSKLPRLPKVPPAALASRRGLR